MSFPILEIKKKNVNKHEFIIKWKVIHGFLMVDFSIKQGHHNVIKDLLRQQ